MTKPTFQDSDALVDLLGLRPQWVCFFTARYLAICVWAQAVRYANARRSVSCFNMYSMVKTASKAERSCSQAVAGGTRQQRDVHSIDHLQQMVKRQEDAQIVRTYLQLVHAAPERRHAEVDNLVKQRIGDFDVLLERGSADVAVQ